MSYNLLLDTKFENNQWKFINCKHDGKKLISNSRVFGIEQELILPDPTKLYFRCSYMSTLNALKEVKIGILNKNTLDIDKRFPKCLKWGSVSVIDYTKEEKIKVCLIFESEQDVNEVYIKEPILVDLNYLHKSTWLKIILDRTINYLPGYSYKNEYKELELTDDNLDLSALNKEKGKVGLIIKENNTKEVKLNAKFISGKYYLVKLDFEEINQLGNIYFKYGFLKSTRIKDQIYLVFKTRENEDLKLIIEPNSELSYWLNIKRLMLIEITKLKLLKEDIVNLPYIGE